RPELGDEEVRPFAREPERAHAEERIVLLRHRQVRDRLVATDVEESYRDRTAGERLDRAAIGGGLFLLGRRRRSLEEQELGSEQAYTHGTERDGLPGVLGVADVREQRDVDAVPRPRRLRRFGQIPG